MAITFCGKRWSSTAATELTGVDWAGVAVTDIQLECYARKTIVLLPIVLNCK